MGVYMGYYVIAGVMFLISMLVSNRLKSKFKQYSKVGMANGLSGKEIAEKMLQDNNIQDVKVISTPGFLSDHYNPAKKTVNLSPDVYEGRSISAAAVAAHEVGHAVQHATAYRWLTMRSKMVPAVQFGANFGHWVILAGIGMMGFGGGNQTVLLIGICLFAITTLFSFITLPVEFDASNRAKEWLRNTGTAGSNEMEGVSDALNWAARTYVVAAIGSLATLVYYVMIFLNRR